MAFQRWKKNKANGVGRREMLGSAEGFMVTSPFHLRAFPFRHRRRIAAIYRYDLSQERRLWIVNSGA
jgi:hypothetical protein